MLYEFEQLALRLNTTLAAKLRRHHLQPTHFWNPCDRPKEPRHKSWNQTIINRESEQMC